MTGHQFHCLPRFSDGTGSFLSSASIFLCSCVDCSTSRALTDSRLLIFCSGDA